MHDATIAVPIPITTTSKTTTRGAAALLAALALSASAAAAEDPRTPSQALHAMYEAMEAHPDRQRRENTAPLMEGLKTEGLGEDERFILGEVYFLDLKPNESQAAFEPFMEGEGLRARVAWQRVMRIRYAAFQQFDEVERMLARFRERFPPTPEDPHQLSQAVIDLANRYREQGDHAAVVRLVEEEFRSLPDDAPYRSYLLPGRFRDSFEAVGRAGDADGMTAEALARVRALRPETAARGRGDLPPGFYRIEDFFLLGHDPEITAEALARARIDDLRERLAGEKE